MLLTSILGWKGKLCVTYRCASSRQWVGSSALEGPAALLGRWELTQSKSVIPVKQRVITSFRRQVSKKGVSVCGWGLAGGTGIQTILKGLLGLGRFFGPNSGRRSPQVTHLRTLLPCLNNLALAHRHSTIMETVWYLLSLVQEGTSLTQVIVTSKTEEPSLSILFQFK